METIQILNDGVDEEDFKRLLEILKGFGEVEVLYDPSNPKDKDVTADDVIERYDSFKKKARKVNSKTNDTKDVEVGKDVSTAEGCVLDTTEGTGEPRRRGGLNETDNTISSAA